MSTANSNSNSTTDFPYTVYFRNDYYYFIGTKEGNGIYETLSTKDTELRIKVTLTQANKLANTANVLFLDSLR
jgi:hypothetical protein